MSPATFEWNAAAAAGTAAGTLALAIVTGVLAALTYDEVQVTRSEMQVTRDLEAGRHRPTLVDRTRAIFGTDWTPPVVRGFLNVEFANVGVGPAVHVRVTATHDDPAVTIGGGVIAAISVDSVESLRLDLTVQAADPPPGEQHRAPQLPDPWSFHLSVECIDRTRTPVLDVLLPMN